MPEQLTQLDIDKIIFSLNSNHSIRWICDTRHYSQHTVCAVSKYLTTLKPTKTLRDTCRHDYQNDVQSEHPREYAELQHKWYDYLHYDWYATTSADRIRNMVIVNLVGEISYELSQTHFD
jgi:hypothetical protein